MGKTPSDYLDNVALLRIIREKIQQGKYRISTHAIDRQNKRKIDARDILYVLKQGVHEESKTGFDVGHQTWNYAIRGKTQDGHELRVIIAFSDEMIVITVILLSKRKI